MEKIKRLFHCQVPSKMCNLECSYCYLGENGCKVLWDKSKENNYKYDVKTIRTALSKKRLGGTCFFVFVGVGETLMDYEIIEITRELLYEGHYVQLITNGTLTKRFQELFNAIDAIYYKHLVISFSLHYLELKRKNMLHIFFNNIEMVKEKGSSFYIAMNHCDEYLPYTNEIKRICKEKAGAYPQIMFTHSTDNKGMLHLQTQLSFKDYYEKGKSYESESFEIYPEIYKSHQSGFCYAGNWSCVLDIGTGVMSRCRSNGPWINIFDDPTKEIEFKAVGHNCRRNICECAIFMAMGVLPGIADNCSYEKAWNRRDAGWFNEEMQSVLSRKLYENNKTYLIEKNKKDTMKIIIYGLGYDFEKSVYFYPELLEHVIAFADQEPKTDYISERPVIYPKDILLYDFDKIVIASSQYFNEIYNKCCKEMRIDSNAIMSLDDYINEEIFLEKYIITDA